MAKGVFDRIVTDMKRTANAITDQNRKFWMKPQK
jgi:hypothetical protein